MIQFMNDIYIYIYLFIYLFTCLYVCCFIIIFFIKSCLLFGWILFMGFYNYLINDEILVCCEFQKCAAGHLYSVFSSMNSIGH